MLDSADDLAAATTWLEHVTDDDYLAWPQRDQEGAHEGIDVSRRRGKSRPQPTFGPSHEVVKYGRDPGRALEACSEKCQRNHPVIEFSRVTVGLVARPSGTANGVVARS